MLLDSLSFIFDIRQMERCPNTLDEVVEDDDDKSKHLEGIVVE